MTLWWQSQRHAAWRCDDILLMPIDFTGSWGHFIAFINLACEHETTSDTNDNVLYRGYVTSCTTPFIYTTQHIVYDVTTTRVCCIINPSYINWNLTENPRSMLHAAWYRTDVHCPAVQVIIYLHRYKEQKLDVIRDVTHDVTTSNAQCTST